MARSKKKIERDHKLNKQVHKEKARLRARAPKKKPKKPTIVVQPKVRVKLKGENYTALLKYCSEHNVKPYKAVKQAIERQMIKDSVH